MSLKQSSKRLTHIFWPQRSNDFHPAILKTGGLLTLALGLMVVALFTRSIGNDNGQVLGSNSRVSATAIIEKTNQERQKSNLQPLGSSYQLEQAALAKAKNMFSQNYWGHNAPDGTQPWSFIDKSGYKYVYAGENLAQGFKTASGVVAGWLASAPHRANLLNQYFQQVGVAAFNGVLQGRHTTLVVALYATPAVANPITTFDKTLTKANTPLGPVVTFSIVKPLSLFKTLPFYTRIVIVLVLILVIIYIAQHVIIKHHHLQWNKRSHSHPLFQAAILLSGLIMIMLSSYGAIQ